MAVLPENFLTSKKTTQEFQASRGQVADVFRGRSGVYIQNLNRVLLEVKNIGPRMVKQARQIVNNGALRIAAQARRDAPYDTGNLHNSIKVKRARKVTKRGKLQAIVRANADYAAWVEFGTWKQAKKKKKTKRPDVRPGTPLYAWAKRHGIPPVALAMSIGRRETGTTRIRNEFGRLLGRKRARSKGVEKQPFMGPAFVEERPYIYEDFLNMVKRLDRKNVR